MSIWPLMLWSKYHIVITKPFSYGNYRAHVLLCSSPLTVKDFEVTSSAVNYHGPEVRRDESPAQWITENNNISRKQNTTKQNNPKNKPPTL